MLSITELAKEYATGTRALESVTFRVEEPQVVAIIGSSGAGKSTLIRCVNRLVNPTSGRVVLNDLDITALGRRELRKARRRMGMIFQEYNLVERLTVMENALSGRLGYVSFWQAYRRNYPPEDISAAFELLERVGQRATRTPGPTRSPAASASASVSPAPSCSGPSCCSWTSPRRVSIPRRRARSCACWSSSPTSAARRR